MTPLLAVAPAGVLVAGAAANSGFDAWTLLTTGGPVGILAVVVWLVLTDKLHTHGDYKRVVDELEAEKTERLRLQAALTDRAIPALTRSTLVLEALSPLLQNEVRLRAATRSPDGE